MSDKVIMTFIIIKNEKQLKDGEKLVEQSIDTPINCSKRRRLAIFVAWASLVIPFFHFGDVISELILYFYHECDLSLSIADPALFIPDTIINLLFLGIIIVNIYGVHKGIPRYIKPWLIFAGVGTVFGIICIMMQAPSLTTISRFYESEDMTYTIISALYFAIMYNYYINIKNGPSSQMHASVLEIGAISSAWIATVIPFCFFVCVGSDLISEVFNEVFVYDHFNFSSIAEILMIIAFLTVTLGISIANIYGVHKDNLRCIRLWLIFTALAVPFCMISTILNYMSIEIIVENNMLFIFIAVVHTTCFIFEFKHYRKINSSYEGYVLNV